MSKDFCPPFSVRSFYGCFLILNGKGEPEAIFRNRSEANEVVALLNEMAKTDSENEISFTA